MSLVALPLRSLNGPPAYRNGVALVHRNEPRKKST
jgi:hypothetical protein